MHPRVLRELAYLVAKSLSVISHGSQEKTQVTGKGEILYSQKGETTNLSACLPSVWINHGTDSPNSYFKAREGQGRDLGQPSRFHQGQDLPDQRRGFLKGLQQQIRVTGVICLDSCKAFDIVVHNILLYTLERDGFDEWVVRSIRKMYP